MRWMVQLTTVVAVSAGVLLLPGCGGGDGSSIAETADAPAVTSDQPPDDSATPEETTSEPEETTSEPEETVALIDGFDGTFQLTATYDGKLSDAEFDIHIVCEPGAATCTEVDAIGGDPLQRTYDSAGVLTLTEVIPPAPFVSCEGDRGFPGLTTTYSMTEDTLTGLSEFGPQNPERAACPVEPGVLGHGGYVAEIVLEGTLVEGGPT